VLVPRWQCGRTIARAGDGGGGDSQDGGEGQVAEAATVAGDYEEEVEEGGDGQSSSLQVGSAAENEMASKIARITLPSALTFPCLVPLDSCCSSTLNLMPPIIPSPIARSPC
jgi:hypothetical protein